MVKVFICLSHLDKYELSQFSSVLGAQISGSVWYISATVKLKSQPAVVLLLNQN